MASFEDLAREFGQSVREARSARGLSQETLGHESDMDRNYVGGIERGERNPSLEAIYKLATALDVPVAELFPDGATPQV